MASAPLKNSFNPPSRPELADFLRAAGNGDNEGVRKFLDKHGGAIDVEDEGGMTALRFAAWTGQENAVELLLEKGALVDEESKHGWTALMYASWRGHAEVVRMLLENGASIDKKNSNHGATSLMIAAAEGYTDTVKLLLENGASLDGKNDNDKTALMLAIEDSHAETAGLLEEWSERKRAEEHARFLEDTDCSRGLTHAIPAVRPLKSSSQPKP